MRAPSPKQRLGTLVETYSALRDIIDGRVVEPVPPEWCVRRGLSEYLLSLSDEALLLAETQGLARVRDRLPPAPAELTKICDWVQSQHDAWERLDVVERPLETTHVNARKRVQIATFVSHATRRLPKPRRVVDVGAGLGHLTRALADSMQVEAIGVDVDSARSKRAAVLSAGRVRFDAKDARTTPVIGYGDFAVGLHACGDLGDAMLRQAADVRAHVMLVSCCLQKVRAPQRPALSLTGQQAGLVFSKLSLGLSNLSNWEEPEKIQAIHLGRKTRHALKRLLRARGEQVATGEETHGVHRRKFRRGLAEAARLACARRGLSPPTEEEVQYFEGLADQHYAVMRRLSLPRAMLGRVVECAVVLDRGAFLEEAGYQVDLGVLVPNEVTPRNLAIIARA